MHFWQEVDVMVSSECTKLQMARLGFARVTRGS